jgi:hypothetical protein
MLINRIFCFFGFHAWGYLVDALGEQSRVCFICGKEQKLKVKDRWRNG